MNNIPVRQRSKKETTEEDLIEKSFEDYRSANTVETSAEDRLMEFVETQITKMSNFCKFSSDIPGFYEFNKALMDFNSVNCSMIALDVLSKEEHQIAKNNYDEFMAEKYMEARSILNPTSLSAQKWASTQEINYYIQNTWKDEYRKLRDEVNAAEKKVAFCRRLLDNLADYKYNLNRLCRNQEIEALNLNGLKAYSEN